MPYINMTGNNKSLVDVQLPCSQWSALPNDRGTVNRTHSIAPSSGPQWICQYTVMHLVWECYWFRRGGGSCTVPDDDQSVLSIHRAWSLTAWLAFTDTHNLLSRLEASCCQFSQMGILLLNQHYLEARRKNSSAVCQWWTTHELQFQRSITQCLTQDEK